MFTAKYRGYDMNLYRSQRHRVLAGVCGGIAENLGWSVAGVRIATFLLFWFTGPLVLFAYVAAIFFIANARYATESPDFSDDESDETNCKFTLKREKSAGHAFEGSKSTSSNHSKYRRGGHHAASAASVDEPTIKDRVFYKGDLSSAKIDQIRQRLRQVDKKIRDMEVHVTSYKYQFDRELNR